MMEEYMGLTIPTRKIRMAIKPAGSGEVVNKSFYKEDSQPPRHPKKYFSKKKAIIRLREIGGDEIIQHEGLIYRLDKNDPSALALYGGHQVIVLNQELVDFEKWMIVSVTELW